MAQVRGQPSIGARVRHENGHVESAVRTDQVPGFGLRPLPGRLDNERFRRRRERRGLLPVDQLREDRGRTAARRSRGDHAVRDPVAAVADGAVAERTASRQRGRDGNARGLRQSAHSQVPVDRRQGRRGPVLQQRGRRPEHASAVLLFET